MGDVILDSFIDSLKLLAVVAVFTYIIAFIEPKLSEKIRLYGKFAPLIGASVSLLPQCGFSVVVADLYKKHHVTLGTLIAVFIATSDEALPVFLSYPNKALHVLPLLALKLVLGILFGYLIDLIFIKDKKSVRHHLEHCEDKYAIKLMHCEGAELISKCEKSDICDCDECLNSDCNKHNIIKTEITGNGILSDYAHKKQLKDNKRANIDKFLIKPLLHSLEIFIYVFIINIIFGIIIYNVGQEKIIEFLSSNKYLAPLLTVIVGSIPNCASSIIISELYIFGGLGFGATLGGLTMNAGVAFMILFKDAKNIKRNMKVLLLMLIISVFISYIFSLIFGFDPLSI